MMAGEKGKTMEQTRGRFEQEAEAFVKAIETIASKPENRENLISYLSYHFPQWLERFANTPEKITAEMRAFAEMII